MFPVRQFLFPVPPLARKWSFLALLSSEHLWNHSQQAPPFYIVQSQDSTSEAGLEVISSQRGRLDWRTLQQLNADIVSCAVTSQTATAWSISASLLLDQSREAAGDLAMPRFYSFKKVEQSEFFIVI